MEIEGILQKGLDAVQPWTKSVTSPEPARRDVFLDAAALVPAVNALLGAKWGYLCAITGLDIGPETGNLEVLYHFGEGPVILSLRVSLPRAKPVVPSVCGSIPAASLFERELMEMFGITCEGAPDSRRLFLSEEWPEGVFPLRKDYIVPAAPEPREG